MGLRGLCTRGSSMHLVMELCPRGTLDLLIHQSSSHRLDPQTLLPIVRRWGGEGGRGRARPERVLCGV